MDRVESRSNHEHAIDIRSSCDAPSSGSSHHTSGLDTLQREDQPSSGSSHDTSGLDTLQREDRPSTSVRTPVFRTFLSSANESNSRNSSFIMRGDEHGRHHWSPINSGPWVSTKLVLAVCQIVAAIVVLSLSRHEHPRAPLFAWIVGYASGCVAMLPLLYWRLHYLNQASVPDSSQPRRGSTSSNPPASLPTLSIMRTSDRENLFTPVASGGIHGVQMPNPRFQAIVEYLRVALDCFFAVWFVFGNVWVFGGHSSSSVAPKLYRLCIVFLTFSYVEYAMPFILCAGICCCLPCIIWFRGFEENLPQNRGAPPESINSLPTYKFKIKKTRNGNGREFISEAGEGGVVAAGTEKERVLSGEDACN
ncbi:hypothetical protein U1Q18_021798 [Sarracenia purpurea var. burkii]